MKSIAYGRRFHNSHLVVMPYRGGRSGYEGQIAGLYDLGATLGKGHYAVVKAAKHVFTGEKVSTLLSQKLLLKMSFFRSVPE